jgi:hypothetical protein
MTNSTSFEAVSHDEMLAVEGGAWSLLARIGIRLAAKAIVYVIDQVTD